MDFLPNEYCFNCKKETFMLIDTHEGNNTCQCCGLVTERLIDQTIEYRQFEDSGVDRQRHGAIRDDSRGDGGLGLSVTGTSSSSRSSAQKMSTRLGPESEDVTFIRAQKLIKTWGGLLNLAKRVTSKAEEQFLKIESKKQNFKGRSIEAIIAAVLYIATRICAIPLKPHDIESVTGVPCEDIKKAYGAMKEYVDPIPSLESSRYCSNFCSKMNLSPEVSAKAFKIAEDIKEKRFLDGKNPRTVASVAIYLAMVQMATHETNSMNLISQYSKVAESTIKKSFKEICDKYDCKLVN